MVVISHLKTYHTRLLYDIIFSRGKTSNPPPRTRHRGRMNEWHLSRSISVFMDLTFTAPILQSQKVPLFAAPVNYTSPHSFPQSHRARPLLVLLLVKTLGRAITKRDQWYYILFVWGKWLSLWLVSNQSLVNSAGFIWSGCSHTQRYLWSSEHTTGSGCFVFQNIRVFTELLLFMLYSWSVHSRLEKAFVLRWVFP